MAADLAYLEPVQPTQGGWRPGNTSPDRPIHTIRRRINDLITPYTCALLATLRVRRECDPPTSSVKPRSWGSGPGETVVGPAAPW